MLRLILPRSARRRADALPYLLLAAAVASAVACRGGSPEAVRNPEPAGECCRALDYLYEASIFKIDVMRIRVQVDDGTAEAVRTLVRGGPRSADLDSAVAARFMTARAATADTEFLMSMSGETFIANTIKSIHGMVRDGRLTDDEGRALTRDARSRFGFLHAAGVRSTDRMRYELVGDTVTTRYVRADTVLMRDRQVGPMHRAALLGSYFAPSSDFRGGLLDLAFGR